MNVAQVPHAFSTAHSNSITVGGSRTVKGFVEMHRKAVNMTLIPPSDTHPRPLQFAGLTKEIRKRQVQFEQQLLSLQEREQQQRQEYNKSTQRGINLTHHLLSGIDNDPSSSEANKMILRGQKKKDVKQQKVLKSE
uniref:Uncharacterized protein n=1 Tax=Trypanosoma congolense (strain IL3000) TaxID=1068625 RepID=F9WGC6_TRYCI|nr:hypothetical protein, unlikely [Trypanosoma congolense IL3000]